VQKIRCSKNSNRASKNLDGGYAMAGLLGHGDSFVFRDPGDTSRLFYQDEVVVASERPVIKLF
jgi:amidophosphoribosyltransferase